MFNGYRATLLLTSLALCTFLGATPRQAARDDCGSIRRLYSPRILREARAQLMLAYVQSHARRTEMVLRVLRGSLTPAQFLSSSNGRLAPQETGDRKLNHLTEFIAARCMPR